MTSFAGWNFIGASSAILRDQGGNIIINVLGGGPAVNAARGFAIQISSAIQSFVQNFMTALNPQITKSYASGEHDYMMTLIFRGARFSFYILLLLALPVIINAEYILTLWLVDVPAHTVPFVQLVLIFALSESLANPLVTAMLATGKIRNYQLVVGGLQMLNLPVSYILLRNGGAPEMVFVVAIAVSVCCEMARLYMLQGMIGISMREFLQKVYFNVIIVTVVAAIVPLGLSMMPSDSLISFLLNCIGCVGCTMLSIFYVGCNHHERRILISKCQTIKNRLLKR
jgi:O-antigen/teichoic acid export membrane protein